MAVVEAKSTPAAFGDRQTSHNSGPFEEIDEKGDRCLALVARQEVLYQFKRIIQTGNKPIGSRVNFLIHYDQLQNRRFPFFFRGCSRKRFSISKNITGGSCLPTLESSPSVSMESC
jgi:hypothetical protein